MTIKVASEGITRPISPPLELTELVDAVCSQTEADGKITTHGESAKHRWTLDKLRKGAGTGADPTEIDVPSGGYTEGARVYHDANQSIATGTTTTLAFNSERYDTDTIHDTVTNNSRLTCKTAGKYIIFANIRWAQPSAETSGRMLLLQLNGTTIIGSACQPSQAVTGSTTNQNVAVIQDLAVNSYVEVQVKQSSGGNIDVASAAQHTPEFGMQRVG